MYIIFVLRIGLVLLVKSEGANAQNVLSSSLQKPSGTNVIVSMKSSTIQVINSVSDNGLSRDELATILAKELRAFTTKSQSHVVSVLERSGADFQSYWITNQIYVKGASQELIKSLECLKEVKSVEKEKIIPIGLVNKLKPGPQPNGLEWHLKIMEVEKVWRETKGEGIIVAVIDSGVRENFGWYDPNLFTREPEDLSGHGTHVMGILAGNGGIGAAPHSKWMACRAAIDKFIMEHALVACAQFILCPSDPSGSARCSGVPHIVSNSWSTEGNNNWFSDVVRAWNKAGIIPFFAVGNSGPRCSTVGSPADYDDVIGVGSTDANDNLHDKSSRGPVLKENADVKITNVDVLIKLFNKTIPSQDIPTNKIKPDIVAPGVDVNSAFMLTDNSYKLMTGTSMATPAAAGVAALLLSIKPKMTLKELKDLLLATTDKDFPQSDSEQCGDIPEDKFPNNLYGHGRINAYKAYKKLKSK